MSEDLTIRNLPESCAGVTHWKPGSDETWHTAVQDLNEANLAQSPHWHTVISKTYRHTPIYLTAQSASGNVAILPAFLLRSRLFGTVVTSMPFLDSGGPCSSSSDLTRLLTNTLIEEARQIGADFVEFRCSVPMELPVEPVTEKTSLLLPLTSNPESLWKTLDSKVRNQIRKAEREGISFEFGGLDKLQEFYEVFSFNMRDLGSPVHAKLFFATAFETFGGKIRIALVRKDCVAIGGLIAIEFKNTLMVPWASTLGQFRSLCPNMLLYWETIKAACSEGFAEFDFGRSSRNSGTYRFKRQWGAIEKQLYWYTIPLNGKPVRRLSRSERRGALLVQLWRHLPVGISRWLGPRIRRCLPQ